jgi:hypothetical protein
MDGCLEDALCCGASEKLHIIGKVFRSRPVCAFLAVRRCSYVNVELLSPVANGQIECRKNIPAIVRR